jgi:hypothetical protein
MKSSFKISILAFVSLLLAVQAEALIMSGTGPAPLTGCPEGSAAMSHLKSSVGWWEGPPFGGGEWHVQYRGDTDAFMVALTNFAAIHAPVLDLVIHDGPKNDIILEAHKKDNPDVATRVDWEFVVWNPQSWKNLYNNQTNTAWVKIMRDNPNFGKPVAAPQLDVYLGGSVKWAEVKIPDGLNVRDERAKLK